MSLAQLEKQIEIANLALAKAEEKGGSRKNKAAIKEELAQFTKVLVKSKARLRELEAIKQQCDEFSACRDAPERKPIGGISVKKMNSWKTRETKAEDEQATKSVVESKKEQRLNDDDSYYKPIVIPWLQKKADDKMTEETKRQIKALSEKLEGDVRETRDEEEGSVFRRVASFGSQMAMSVSTLGTHIFGSEEPTKSKSSKRKTEEKPLNKSIHDSIRHVIDSDKEDREAGSTTSSVRSFSSELEEIAEKELKAREAYIKATKKRQELRKSGVKEDSEEWKTSEKTLRDGYAQMEYWESVYAKELKRFRADDSVGSGESSKPDSLSKMLGKRDSFKIDCDEEESKAREAYTQAMTYHQTLITQKVSTNSEEWTKSQKRIQDCYATLQYWERRSSSAVLPAA